MEGFGFCSSLEGKGGGGYLVWVGLAGELDSRDDVDGAGGDSGGERWVGGGDKDEDE